MDFSLVVPLWNEEKNVPLLVRDLVESGLLQNGLSQVILVNNGSTDRTGAIVHDLARQYRWIKGVHLPENLNYGGGVYEGLKHCRTDIVAYIPGDLQVSAGDLLKVWERYRAACAQRQNRALVKGRRTVREDGWNTRVVSVIYTVLANILLGVRVKDVNGLPKMFHKDLLNFLPDTKMKTFVFDVQLLLTARKNRWPVHEVPVAFHARRQGVSSWSRKRANVYRATLKQMFQLKRLYP